jgi:hypothetical protein
MYKNIDDFKKALISLKGKGFIESLRSSDTGIGYTLEECLGIQENNVPLADLGAGIELKAFRKDSSSLLTLFTCEPLPEGGDRDKILLEKFGYKKRDNSRQKELYCTIKASTFNPQSLRLEVEKDRIKIVSEKENIGIYWIADQLKERFLQKIPMLITVKADSRIKENGKEEFHFNEAYLLKGFSFASFKNMVAKDIVTVDLRMHLREAGTVRNHGTAFRIRKSKIGACFQESISLI